MMSASPLYWSFMAALSLAVALSLVLFGYVWPRRSSPGAWPLLGLIITVVFWSVGYIFEYSTTHIQAKLLAWDISYVGAVILPVMLFAFALRFTHRGQWLTPRVFLLFLIIPAITLILQWTKDFHSLMYYDMHLVQDGPFLLVAKIYGPWFWVAATYNYVLILASISSLIYRLFTPPLLFADQAAYLLIVITVPACANLEYIFHFLPFPHADWTPAAFAVSAIAMTFAISRHRFLDVLPVARESAIELMSEGFLVLDNQNRVVDFNRGMREILAVPESSIHGRQLPDAILKQLTLNNEFGAKHDANIEVEIEGKAGSRCYSVHSSPFNTGRSQDCGHVLVFYDITERKHVEEAIRQMAFYDQLTGLPNRTLFADRAGMALSVAGRYKRMLAVMVIDVDRFKRVNDTYGHAAGDQVLQDISLRFSTSVRKVDTVSRLGGDEFLVLLPEISGEETLDTVSRRIMEAVFKPFQVSGNEIKLTVSIGMAIYPGDGFDLDLLIKNADIAMYQVKQAGRSGYRRYTLDMAGQPFGIPAEGTTAEPA
jgi:diguanylate cyclase (GGDEF)-like protein/PAS domain S-box-containing protein